MTIPVTVKTVDTENFSLVCVFSSQTEDRHGDVVMQDGWDLKNYKKNPVILNSHNYDDATEVIGRAIPKSLKIENKELVGEIVFAVNENPKAKIIFDLYAGGFLNAFSVGFIPKKFKEDNFFVIEESELLELSAVSVPANARALAKSKGIDVDSLDEADESDDVDAEDDAETPEIDDSEADADETAETTDTDDEEAEDVEIDAEEQEPEVSETREEKSARLLAEKAAIDAQLKALDETATIVVPAYKPTNRKTLMVHAIHKINSDRTKTLIVVRDIITSVLNDGTAKHLDADTKDKVEKRKINQAIRKLITAK